MRVKLRERHNPRPKLGRAEARAAPRFIESMMVTEISYGTLEAIEGGTLFYYATVFASNAEPLCSCAEESNCNVPAY